MRRVNTVLLVFGILVAGCSSQGPGQVKAEDMVGLWTLDLEGASSIYEFKEDGISEFSLKVDRDGVPDPNIRGMYWFEGTQLRMQDTEDLRVSRDPQCTEVGAYEVQFLEGGNLKFTPVDEPCPHRNDSLVGPGLVDYEWRRME